MPDSRPDDVHADDMDLSRLRQNLDKYFSESELRDLCFDLDIDYEGLSDGSKSDKARELAGHCKRHGRIAELTGRCRQLRPNVSWGNVSDLFEFSPFPPSLPAARHAELPHQPYFFGREQELARIADALDPESVGWGVLIDGAGGIGKTALAIRAGYLSPDETFPTKIFLSAKTRELLPHGEQKLEDFQLPNYMALLAELARELGEDGIAKCNPNERAKEVRRALEDRQALVIIDNLETLEEQERERLFQFLRQLPRSCKAIVTSRCRTDVAAEIIRLDRLTPEAAHALIAKLAERYPLLARASKDERDLLYQTAGGTPLLIEWLAGQLGRPGSQCRTVADACAFMQSAPPGNDPLEYIFGDLLDTFTESETAVLAVLSHFTLPAKTKWIAEMTSFSLTAAQTALEDLTDRALVVADAQFQTFLLPPLAVAFLRRKHPEIIAQTGERLADRVLALVQENGYENYERFPILGAEWSAIAAALPLFLQGDNARLQHLCYMIDRFLHFSGRWDEQLTLNLEAEKCAQSANDTCNAGWRAYQAARVYFRLGLVAEMQACARRVEAYWADSGAREKAAIFRLRGRVHRLEKNYPAAVAALQEAIALDRTPGPESDLEELDLNELAWVERLCDDTSAAERDFREALRIATQRNNRVQIAISTGDLAALMIDRQDWQTAEKLAREALQLAEDMGRQTTIGFCCQVIAQALAGQGQPMKGLPYARRAVEILSKLHHRYLEGAQAVLKECEQGNAADTPSVNG